MRRNPPKPIRARNVCFCITEPTIKALKLDAVGAGINVEELTARIYAWYLAHEDRVREMVAAGERGGTGGGK